VLVVLDVTPYTARRAREIAEALAALGERRPATRAWRFARLGESPSRVFEGPGDLGPVLLASVAQDTDVRATLPALHRTVKALRDRGAAIVYLADWRLEDDVGCEAFLDLLRRGGHRFGVVGGEAGFGRAWTDGFYPPDRGARDSRGRTKLYAEGIGRSPFGPEDPREPWHGGDTAWPHLPFHVGGTPWSTRFPVELPSVPPRKAEEGAGRYAPPEGGQDGEPGRDGAPEDLQERLEEGHAPGTLERYWFPLPSGFGPYALMRLAGETGGRYVLWSWNPAGRSDVEYDYGRVGLFAPDLRARKEIHADVARRPLARALVAAWHEIANPDAHIAYVTPPLRTDARTPVPMEEVRGDILSFSWDTRREYEAFLALAPMHLEALERAAARLRAGLAEPTADGVDRRYEADARLFLHVLEVKRFQLGEALAAARGLDVKTAWSRLPLHPTLDARYHVEPGRRYVAPTGLPLHDEAAGASILQARKAHLERFAGTPFAELVHRNGVCTYEVTWVGYAEGQPVKESPGESSGGRPHTPPPSGGSGPTTGR
jgi:hypothetical protein